MPDRDLSRSHGEARIERLEDLVERRLAAQDSGNWTAPQIKEFVEALLIEKDRALAMADDEREKAAAALRGEQQRALDQAERERGKAAENLRLELARSISEGDARLSEHIENQIHQIREALASADRLEIARVHAIEEQIKAVARELKIVNESSEKAIQKAEDATERRFESVNEFRAQLASQTASFLPREVFETTVTQWSEWRTAVDRDRARIVGAGEQRSDTRLTHGAMFAIVSAAVGVLGLIIVFANLITSH